MEVLRVENVFAGFGNKAVLKDVNLSVNRGEFILIKGKNGSGKSTLVRVIGGILKPFRGKIFLKGKDITSSEPWKRVNMGISVLLQGGRVFPYLTVREHFKLLGKNEKEFIEKASEIFPFIKKFLDVRAGVLSGGQRSMLSLALTLLRNPEVLILDEPLAGLDKNNVDNVVENLHSLKSEGKSILAIEHREEIQSVADRVFILKEGKLFEEEIRESVHEEVLV